MKTVITVIAALALTAAPAIADEAWITGDGFEIVYETDIDDYAVLSYPGDDPDIRELAFIEGLGFNYDDRGRHDGYWAGPLVPVEEGCPVSIVDHTGVETNNWGRVEVIFLEPAFPTGFVAQRGYCFDEPRDQLVAHPLTADDYTDEEWDTQPVH